jgi:hypothetical protein
MVHLVVATRRRTHNLTTEDGGVCFSTALRTEPFVEDLRYGLCLAPARWNPRLRFESSAEDWVKSTAVSSHSSSEIVSSWSMSGEDK